MDFLYTNSPMMVMWQTPRADKVSKIVLKVPQEDFSNTNKKSYWLHLPFFFSARGGGTTRPDAINIC